jgi:hypothetical protein
MKTISTTLLLSFLGMIMYVCVSFATTPEKQYNLPETTPTTIKPIEEILECEDIISDSNLMCIEPEEQLSSINTLEGLISTVDANGWASDNWVQCRSFLMSDRNCNILDFCEAEIEIECFNLFPISNSLDINYINYINNSYDILVDY